MKKEKRANPFIRIGLFAVLIVIFINLMLGLMDINEKKMGIDTLALQIKDKNEDIAEVNGVLAADDKELIEKYAREKLGFGAAGERVYIDISGK